MSINLEKQWVKTEYFTVNGAALYLSMSERTIRSCLTDPLDPIPHFRKGRMIRIRRSELERWFENHRAVDLIEIDKLVDELI